MLPSVAYHLDLGLSGDDNFTALVGPTPQPCESFVRHVLLPLAIGKRDT